MRGRTKPSKRCVNSMQLLTQKKITCPADMHLTRCHITIVSLQTLQADTEYSFVRSFIHTIFHLKIISDH